MSRHVERRTTMTSPTYVSSRHKLSVLFQNAGFRVTKIVPSIRGGREMDTVTYLSPCLKHYAKVTYDKKTEKVHGLILNGNVIEGKCLGKARVWIQAYSTLRGSQHG